MLRKLTFLRSLRWQLDILGTDREFRVVVEVEMSADVQFGLSFNVESTRSLQGRLHSIPDVAPTTLERPWQVAG